MPILGTPPDAIDLAEDRDRFKRLLDKLGLKQPQERHRLLGRAGARSSRPSSACPLVVRPSYVLGGRAMAIVRDETQFDDYLLDTLPSWSLDVKARYPNDKTGQINTVLGKNPLLFDRYLSDAIEIDVDALCDGKDVFVAGIMEHIEEAGIHSGDSACSLPPHSLSPETIAELERQTAALALALEGRRPDERAVRHQGRRHLRARGQPARLAHGAVRRQGDRRADRQDRARASWPARRSPRFGLKPPKRARPHRRQGGRVPFARFPGVDTCSGPRCARPARSWASTATSRVAFAKSQLGAGTKLPTRRHRVRLGARRRQGRASSTPCAMLAARLQDRRHRRHPALPRRRAACRPTKINKVLEGRPHVVDAIKNGDVQLVFNTTEGAQALADSRSLRRAALLHKVPYYTTLAGAIAAAAGIKAYLRAILKCAPLQSYFADAMADS